MRTARILGEPNAAANSYHLMSRAIEGRFIFDRVAKERFRQYLEAHAKMAGIEIYTWCCMSNHFHLLVEVPNAEECRRNLGDDDIIRRLSLVMKPSRVLEVRQSLAHLKSTSPDGSYLEYREKLLARMFDVSVFMRELKQRFTQWHNRRVGRKGPLWEDRFKSVLLEDDENVLLTMAAYIDLNPVRAGLVKDSKDYRWCGYGEAIAGNRSRRNGLMRVFGEESEDGRKWKRYHAYYRDALYGTLRTRSGRAQHSDSFKNSLPISKVVRVRVRYFTQSIAFGSQEWVEEVFSRNLLKLRVTRRVGARKPKEEALAAERWRGLVDLRSAS